MSSSILLQEILCMAASEDGQSFQCAYVYYHWHSYKGGA